MRGKRAHKAGSHCSCCNAWNPISRADEKRATEKEIGEGYKLLSEDLEEQAIAIRREIVRKQKNELEKPYMDSLKVIDRVRQIANDLWNGPEGDISKTIMASVLFEALDGEANV